MGCQSDHDSAPSRTTPLECPRIDGNPTSHSHRNSFLGKLSDASVVDNVVAYPGAHEDCQPHRSGYNNQPHLAPHRDHACDKASDSGTNNRPTMTAGADGSHPTRGDSHRNHAYIGGCEGLALTALTMRFRP